RATRVTVELGRNTSPNATLFEVIGGPTQLDNNGISTDGNGNLTVTGKVIYNHTLGGANQVLLSLFPTDGAKEWRINYNADSTISFFDATDGKVALKLLTSGGILTDNGAITTDGAGNLSATSLKEGTTRVAVQGAHSAGQPIISYCVGGPPATLAANEICIQLS
ncbi:MAG: hypothetical protein ACXWQR_19350, partial [Ktedonobacterales bacterium]